MLLLISTYIIYVVEIYFLILLLFIAQIAMRVRANAVSTYLLLRIKKKMLGLDTLPAGVDASLNLS